MLMFFNLTSEKPEIVKFFAKINSYVVSQSEDPGGLYCCPSIVRSNYCRLGTIDIRSELMITSFSIVQVVSINVTITLIFFIVSSLMRTIVFSNESYPNMTAFQFTFDNCRIFNGLSSVPSPIGAKMFLHDANNWVVFS